MLASIALFVMIVAMTGTAKEQNFVTHLSGDQQVPPVATNAQGQAIFKWSENGKEVNFKLIAANIKNITAGYIQLGSAGINGPVVANLYTGPTIVGRADGLIAEGNITASNLKGPLSGKNLSSLIEAMLSGNIYVNVLTTQNPTGEIRGQISHNGKLIEYVCVDKAATASPPPDIPGNKVKGVKQSLCEDGKVPESLIPMENKLKHMPEEGLISNVFCPYSGVCYEYAVSYQQIYNTGVSAYLSQHNPYVNPVDYHSVAEITVQNTNFGPSPGDAVEVGWIKNVNDVTRLFTFWWLNGNPQCYNGCGWRQWSATEYPGMAIATNFYPTIKDGYIIQNWQGNWWIWYNGQWIGYYPGSLWNGNFMNGNLVQYFGEVSARSFPTNTQMGNGQYCRNEAIIDNQKYLNGAWINSNTIKFANYPYTETALSSNAMIYGGPVNPNIACLPNPIN